MPRLYSDQQGAIQSLRPAGNNPLRPAPALRRAASALLAAVRRLVGTGRRPAAPQDQSPQMIPPGAAPQRWESAHLQDALVLHRTLPDGDRREWLATGRLTPQAGSRPGDGVEALPFLVYQPTPGRETFWSPKQLNTSERALILAELRRHQELQLVPPGYQGEIDARLDRSWAGASRVDRLAMRERAQAAFVDFFNRTWRAKMLGEVLPLEENTHATGRTPSQAEAEAQRLAHETIRRVARPGAAPETMRDRGM